MTARDPGLQPERTALAWQRTGVTASGVSAAAVLMAAHTGRAWLVVATCVLAAVGGVCAVVGSLGGSRAAHHAIVPGKRDSPWLRLVATAAATTLAAVAGVLLSLG